jgi:hypothetical protein
VERSRAVPPRPACGEKVGVRGVLATAGGQEACPCHEKGGEKSSLFNGKVLIPGRPIRAGPGTHEHWLVPNFRRPVFMGSGLACEARAPE